MESNTEKYFPSVYDEYYYYCRIPIVEEAKEKYMNCNGFLLGSGLSDSPVMKLIESETDEKKKAIYKKYQKLYKDYIAYSDKLINKENIENQNDYIHCMHNLMRIANETIMFTYENFGIQKNKILYKKMKYKEKDMKLSDIIDLNRSIPYILYPDEIATVITNKYFSVIYDIILILIFVLSMIFIRSCAVSIISYYSALDIFELFICSIVFIIAGIVLLVTRISYRKKIRLIEIKSNAHSRNKNLVLHPYSSRFSLKNVKEIIGIITNLIK